MQSRSQIKWKAERDFCRVPVRSSSFAQAFGTQLCMSHTAVKAICFGLHKMPSSPLNRVGGCGNRIGLKYSLQTGSQNGNQQRKVKTTSIQRKLHLSYRSIISLHYTIDLSRQAVFKTTLHPHAIAITNKVESGKRLLPSAGEIIFICSSIWNPAVHVTHSSKGNLFWPSQNAILTSLRQRVLR